MRHLMVNPGKKLKKKSIIWARICVKFTPLNPRILSVQSLFTKSLISGPYQADVRVWYHVSKQGKKA